MFLAIAIVVAVIAISFGFVLIESDYTGGGFAAIGIGLIFAVIFLGIHFFGTESGSRAIKNFSSDLSGLNRTLEVYDMTGNLIKTYEGKFDINNNEQGVIKFDLNGKRHLIYNAIVIVDEKIRNKIMISKHTAKVGDTIRILGLAHDSDGKPDPSEQRYIGKEGVVEYIDSRDILHGTWGGIGLLVVDSYKIIKKCEG